MFNFSARLKRAILTILPLVVLVKATAVPTKPVQLAAYTYSGGVLSGTIDVQNIAYTKLVSVYYSNSANVWNVAGDMIAASYVAAISGTAYETWQFSGTVGSGGISQFFIQYNVSGSTYYDPGNYVNYVVTAATSTTTSTATSTSTSTSTATSTTTTSKTTTTTTTTTTATSVPTSTSSSTVATTTAPTSTLQGSCTYTAPPTATATIVPYCDDSNPISRTDCGFSGINETGCEGKGCCWNPVTISGENIPWCFYKTTGATCSGYQVVSQAQSGSTTILQLLLNGAGCAKYGTDITNLTVTITPYSDEIVRVLIQDSAKTRWQIPTNVVPAGTPGTLSTPQYTVAWACNPFTFTVTRATGEVIFNSSVSGLESLIFEDEYLQIGSVLPTSANIYGLGDFVDSFRRDPTNTLQTFWSRDHATPVKQNQYGSHPVYYEMRNGKTHAVFLRNSNGMDVSLASGQIEYKVIGGVLDFYFVMGPTPAAALDQYTQIIGRPNLIPRWSLGFHQCRYGWATLSAVETVYNNLMSNGLYVDTMWGDINYMSSYKDFTYDTTNYAGLPAFVTTLHNNNQKYVVITDPGIANTAGYTPYDTGLTQDVFIKNADGTYFVGSVWPGSTVYPDWFAVNVDSWWATAVTSFRSTVNFDGLWIDMNEASNFNNGGNSVAPAYSIHNDGGTDSLDTKAISTSAVHHGNITEYNVHNMFGHMEGISTYKALLASRPTERPFILSRSTFASSGKWVNHWLGDNHAQWADIYYSITGVLGMNLFGVPHSGSDICGFIGDSDEEICNRWAQIGAFYPFSRHHKDTSSSDSYFYLWTTVTQSAKTAFGIRYTLLPYFYTLHAQSSQTGAAVWRALWYEFPADSSTYAVDTQILVGSGLMVSPVITEGATTVVAYFPAAIWYDWYTFQATGFSGNVTLTAALTYINVHVRGGTILPAQYPAQTTYLTALNNYFLIVALDASGAASGTIYADDGITVGAASTTINLTATGSNTVQGTGAGRSYTISQKLQEVRVWGVTTAPGTVKVNGVASGTASYSSSTKVLTITGLTVNLNSDFTLTW